MRAVGWAGPLVAGVLSYAIEAVREKAFLSKYALYSGLELAASAFLGNLATAWVGDYGFIGLGGEIASDAISGVLYMLMRRYIQKEMDNKLNDFVYGALLSYAGDALATPVFSAFGSTRLAWDVERMEAVQDASARVIRNELMTSNISYPPGSSTPANIISTTGPSYYAQPCLWSC